jgi:hypothetical protein
MQYLTGSVRRSSAVPAKLLLFQRRRHKRTPARKRYLFMFMSTKSLNGWAEKRGGGSSWFRSAHQLESFIVSIMGQHFLVQDIIM